MSHHRRLLWVSTAVGLSIAGFACGDDGAGDPADPAGRADPVDKDADASDKTCTATFSPGKDDQATILGAFIDAESGDTICLKKGRYKLTGQLTLATERVTVQGEEGTILDFSDQSSGANGIELSADHDTLDTLWIENPKGDGVRATAVDYPTIRNVHVEWTGGPDASNGGYGIYPVTSSHVLIEDCFASGASDTGIYVGQSHDIIIRNNEATGNVAGIEVENSTDAEVYGNHAHGNSGGILVFNLPGLPVKDGKRANVHDNQIEDNNLANFAPAGNIIADVPQGTGLFVLASDDNEIHGNTIKNHKSVGISIVSWYLVRRDEEGKKDPDYNWFPERNNIHDNTLSDNGADPQGTAALIAALTSETRLPDLTWDGIVDTDNLGGGTVENGVPPESVRNCFKGNGDATFINLDIEHNGAGKSTDVTPYECTRDALEKLEF
jgi:parallel beta-helix repeat protein